MLGESQIYVIAVVVDVFVEVCWYVFASLSGVCFLCAWRCDGLRAGVLCCCHVDSIRCVSWYATLVCVVFLLIREFLFVCPFCFVVRFVLLFVGGISNSSNSNDNKSNNDT